MRLAARLGLAAAVSVVTVVSLAAPAMAVHAGEFCSNADGAAGTTTTAENGVTVQCLSDGAGHYRWTQISSASTTASPASASPTTTGVLTREAGEFCSPVQVAVNAKGQALSCSEVDANGRYHWVVANGDLAGTLVVTNATTATTLRANNVAARSTTRAAAPRSASALASTGLRHTDKLIELGVMLLGLGTAIVIGRRPGVIH